MPVTFLLDVGKEYTVSFWEFMQMEEKVLPADQDIEKIVLQDILIDDLSRQDFFYFKEKYIQNRGKFIRGKELSEEEARELWETINERFYYIKKEEREAIAVLMED